MIGMINADMRMTTVIAIASIIVYIITSLACFVKTYLYSYHRPRFRPLPAMMNRHVMICRRNHGVRIIRCIWSSLLLLSYA